MNPVAYEDEADSVSTGRVKVTFRTTTHGTTLSRAFFQ
eukprot:CAMPEP_0202907026 /NCGR_PEP_ID=MMETSP1392-20130828/41028_1 /ASSEMBLY_ACC=CAM_ASM_000868 /TAXON_ID=225041 /ORGANISM="Chlamydomonas chlamydogama, Strain SAG 11-48b" /LENGTH=37 /DNA_ID= /DNA_START= /DNA_END= /DNA_ORIENTATION=